MLRSGSIRLNLQTAPHSAVRAQILDGQTAEPIPGYTWEEAVPINGDHLFAEPRWKERQDASELVGRPIRLELALTEAQIYAIRMECDPYVAAMTPEEFEAAMARQRQEREE
jgi:hypothetical protein